MSKKVSVIIPCFNSAKTIEKTVYSVLNQSHSNVEVIIVDDCSNDNTISIVNGIMEKHSNVFLISTLENTGAPALPRNIGIGCSTGDYICFLDSDDIWYGDKLKFQVEFMESNNVSFSYLPYDISFNGVVQETYYPPLKINHSSLLRLNVIGCLTTMFKAELIRDKEFSSVKLEDYDFWLKVLLEVDYAYCASNVSLACYSKLDNSRSSNKLSLVVGYWRIFLKHSNRSRLIALFRTLVYFRNYFFKYKNSMR
ncbi:MAG: glycosyltransferase family 2 protein [Plesiomonas shigelloides]